jgi:hypothetical protein
VLINTLENPAASIFRVEVTAVGKCVGWMGNRFKEQEDWLIKAREWKGETQS